MSPLLLSALGCGSPPEIPVGGGSTTTSTGPTSSPTPSSEPDEPTDEPFEPRTERSEADAAWSLALLTDFERQVAPTGDRDGDGLADLLIAEAGSFWWESGPVLGDARGQPLWVDVEVGDAFPAGDVNGDGLADVWTYDPSTYAVGLRSGADPTAVFSTLYFVDDRIEVADVDGDSQPELVVHTPGEVGRCPMALQGASLARADCILVTGTSDSEFAADFATGDLDGDGVDDVLVSARAAVGDEYGYAPGVFLVAGPWTVGGRAVVDLGLVPWLASEGGYGAPKLSSPVDLDGDGRLEVLADLGRVYVLDSTLTEVATFGEVSSVWGGPETYVGHADLDGDGEPEVLLGGEDEASAVLGPFVGELDRDRALVRVTLPADGAWIGVAAMDWNADGALDLLVEQVGLPYPWTGGDSKQVWALAGPF